MSMQYPNPPPPDGAGVGAGAGGGMQMTAPPPLPKANQACLSCRRQKRKCDKALPGCSLCVRMNRNCDYSTPTQQPTADDYNILRQKLHDAETRLNQLNAGASITEESPYTPATTLSGHNESVPQQVGQAVYIQHDPAYMSAHNRFPAIAFLDAEAFKYGQVAVPKAVLNIPVEIVDLVGNVDMVESFVAEYFASIHTWFPFISMLRVTRLKHQPIWEGGCDQALLFLCMRLITTKPQDGPGVEGPLNYLYLSAKRLLNLVENSGVTSLMVLQSYILVSLYELSHAIYPGAWMTVGACVRYGLLLDLNAHEAAPALLDRPQSWVELEERKRTWWAVLIMDRAVALGGQGRSFASDDPGPNAELPVDVGSFDDGEMVPSPMLGTSSTYAESRSPFGRLCQASLLLGKVIRHHYTPSNASINKYNQASEIYHEASELCRLLAHEAEEAIDYLPHTPALAICFSATMTLCDHYARLQQHPDSTSTPEASAMQVQAIDGVKSVSVWVNEMAVRITDRTQNPRDVDRCSPFTFNSLYSAGQNFSWSAREAGDQTSIESLENIRGCLRGLGWRWKASKEYVRIIEAQEFTYAVAPQQ